MKCGLDREHGETPYLAEPPGKGAYQSWPGTGADKAIMVEAAKPRLKFDRWRGGRAVEKDPSKETGGVAEEAGWKDLQVKGAI